jgi:hypothetical protein
VNTHGTSNFCLSSESEIFFTSKLTKLGKLD